MKKFFLSLTIFIASSFAFTSEVSVFKKPKVLICGAKMPGCSPKLMSAEGNELLIDVEYSKVDEWLTKLGNHKKAQNEEIQIEEVIGVVVSETGHFPNPTATFEVLKVLMHK